MPKTITTLLKVALWGSALVLVCLALAVLWLRHEFARVSSAGLESDYWQGVPVRPLAPASTHGAKCAQQHPAKRALFGALHVHTSASYDATAFGVTTTVDQAYRFGRGEPLALRLLGDAPGQAVPDTRLSVPLDFMAVTDHAESLGEHRLCSTRGSAAYGALVCRLYRGDLRLPAAEDMQPILRLATMAIFGQDRSTRICGEDGSACRNEAAAAWEINQRVTEQHQDRSPDCSFTTLHAYEYTLAEESSNLHRNVIFSSETVPQVPLSSRDAQTPEALWTWLRDHCIDGHPNCDVLAIPHNSNWSSGRMWFPYSNRNLSPQDRIEQASLRARLEPLVEIMQTKGDSECRNGIPSVLGAPDEFCDFEKLRPASEPIEDCGESVGSGGMMLRGCASRYSYVRYALAAGLKERSRLGVNPFAMGIVAATDTHNGTPAAGAEDNYQGSHGSDRSLRRRLQGQVDVPGDIGAGSPVRYNPGGIAGVYAEENSREAIFAAMRRRETFGTSGPRIEPRFFAGPADAPFDCDAADLVTRAYSGGVPMGGEIQGSQADSAGPLFLASARADPIGNPLQRIQVVKVWIDRDGNTRQAVFDVAGSPDNRAGVDPQSCDTYGEGHLQLCATWRDPSFEPDLAAVYYSRVLENPSCRWSHRDCLRLPEAERPPSCSDPDLPWRIQERAWTSPIWYYPDA